MRIIHVTPWSADAWAYGGIPRVVGALARQQAADGHSVTVCATDAGTVGARLERPVDDVAPVRSPWRPVRLATDLELRVFPNRSNRLAYGWHGYLPIGLHQYLRDHARDFDVAHIHACRHLPGAIAAYHLSRHGVPYVLAPNGTAPVIERRQLAKHLFDAVAGTRILRGAAAVIAVSEAERRQLHALGVPDDRIRLVPNPVEVAEFDPPLERGRFRRRAGLADCHLITFLGKITPRKRLDVVTRAFGALRGDFAGSRLVIAGNDMGGLDDVHSLARELGVNDRIHFTGLVTGRERLEVLADADVVVYPSEHEVFGLVPLEALLAGTPVIVAGDSGCGEVVGATGGGLIVPGGDASALASAIASVLSDPDRWRAAAAHAARRVRQTYKPAAVTALLEQAYTSLVRPAQRTVHLPLGVSVVIPVRNGLATIARTLSSIETEAAMGSRPVEILVVDDRSRDGSTEWLKACADAGRIRLLAGSGRGAAAALNLASSAATHPVICQVDQDVELLPGWMSHVVGALERDSRLGAVQAQYTTDPEAPAMLRAVALDLEQRYLAIAHGATEHVCTGNSAYRAEALRAVGFFDETLGYGYDGDLSYRLSAAGWRLAHCPEARSLHRWREGLAGYVRQQYGYGYGRLDVVARHPARVTGDSVSPASMMAHPMVMLVAIGLLLTGAAAAALDFHRGGMLVAGATLLALLVAERSVAAVRAWFRFKDPAALLFPALHLVRDCSWVAAIVVWSARRLTGRESLPSHSMRARPVPPAATPQPNLVARRGGEG